MGLRDDTDLWLGENRDLVEVYRGEVPAGLVGALIVSETGKEDGGDWSVSADHDLVESGRSQEPLFVAWRHCIDPFNREAGIWLRCKVFLDDARWLRKDYPGLFRELGRDLWWGVLLRYSIGKSALRHVIECTTARMRRHAAEGLPVNAFVEEAIAWAKRTDLALPQHKRFWGKQSPAKILERITGGKHLRRLDVAQALGGLTPMPGGEPPAEAPPHLPIFPSKLVGAARVGADPDASHEDRYAAWQVTRAYAKRERAAARAKQPGILFRALRTIEVWRRGPRPTD
jgi:hypothetical protein